MKLSTRHKLAMAILSTTCLSGAMAMGQGAPVVHAPGSQGGADAGSRMMGGNGTVQIGLSIGRHGGSLYQASLAATAPQEPGQTTVVHTSYYAVAQPVPKTLKKHDLVTIVIREESTASSKAQNDLKKNVQLQAEVNQWVKLKLGQGSIYGLPTPSAQPGIDVTGNRLFHGEGEMDRTDSLTARITAEILDVKPNGTLVLQARKHIKTDDEEQQFILTGICRAQDIAADNTILSTQMYDMSLQKNSKGDVRESTERGRLPKLLDLINPF